jgi:DUF1365 family protein
MRANKNDSNRREIVSALNSMGLQWFDTPTTRTQEPRVDGIAFNPVKTTFRFVEIKGKSGKLTQLQQAFIYDHPYQCVILRNIKDCENLRAML